MIEPKILLNKEQFLNVIMKQLYYRVVRGNPFASSDIIYYGNDKVIISVEERSDGTRRIDIITWYYDGRDSAIFTTITEKNEDLTTVLKDIYSDALNNVFYSC